MTATGNEVGRRSGWNRLPGIGANAGATAPSTASYLPSGSWQAMRATCGPPERPPRRLDGLNRRESLV